MFYSYHFSFQDIIFLKFDLYELLVLKKYSDSYMKLKIYVLFKKKSKNLKNVRETFVFSKTLFCNSIILKSFCIKANNIREKILNCN